MIEKDHRFPVEFWATFPKALLLMGPITPDIPYSEDRNKIPPQTLDPVTGVKVWKAAVIDPHQTATKRAAFDLFILSNEEPQVPGAAAEISDGVRSIIVEGLTAQPRLMGMKPYQHLGYVYRATGIANRPVNGPASADPATAGKAGAVRGGSADKASAA